MGDDGISLVLPREAMVVFEDRREAWSLRWLRPGFRHCFCLVGDGGRWTLLDPLKSRLAVAILCELSASDLAERLATENRRFLHGLVTCPEAPQFPALRPLTCVEVVKRLVGLHASAVVTPHQLYHRLQRPEGGRPAYQEIITKPFQA